MFFYKKRNHLPNTSLENSLSKCFPVDKLLSQMLFDEKMAVSNVYYRKTTVTKNYIQENFNLKYFLEKIPDQNVFHENILPRKYFSIKLPNVFIEKFQSQMLLYNNFHNGLLKIKFCSKCYSVEKFWSQIHIYIPIEKFESQIFFQGNIFFLGL